MKVLTFRFTDEYFVSTLCIRYHVYSTSYVKLTEDIGANDLLTHLTDYPKDDIEMRHDRAQIISSKRSANNLDTSLICILQHIPNSSKILADKTEIWYKS